MQNDALSMLTFFVTVFIICSFEDEIIVNNMVFSGRLADAKPVRPSLNLQLGILDTKKLSYSFLFIFSFFFFLLHDKTITKGGDNT